MAIINGTPGNDNLNGTSGDDTINAGTGNDTVNAGDGNDVVIAGPSSGTGTPTALDFNWSLVGATLHAHEQQ